MLCVLFQLNRRRAWWSGLLALGLAGPSLASGSSATSTDEAGFLYCLDNGGTKIFAGKTMANGNLRFGISVWSPTGQNISVFGTAARVARGWRFSEDLRAHTRAERCQLDIIRGANGTLRVVADPDATCQAHGGVNAAIGTIQFPRTTYEGPVTTELENPEAFQKAIKCVRTEQQ
jgi:hypothetical protein